jgi:beta-phosphoglucomutase
MHLITPKHLIIRVIRGFVFDLDGTLADSIEAHYLSFRDMFDTIGVSFEMEAFKRHFGKLSDNIIRDFLAQEGVSPADPNPERLSALKQEYFISRHAHRVSVLPNVLDFLKKLSGEGYGMAVASNSPRKNVSKILENTGLGMYFNVVVSSDGVGNPKPHPEIFLTACDHLKLKPSECAGVEDSVHGLQAVINAGMYCIGVLTGGASRREMLTYKPDQLVDYLTDINLKALP